MSEPVTVSEFKDYARVTSADEDAVIEMCLLAAREKVEDETDRALVPKTVTLVLNKFPPNRRSIELPAAPVRSIASVQYVDAAGDTQTMDAGDYSLLAPNSQSTVPKLVLAIDADWPSPGCIEGAVTITYAAGYADPADLPRMLHIAVLWLAGWYYEQRLHVNIGNIVNTLPDHLNSIVWANKSLRRYVEDVVSISSADIDSAAGGDLLNLPAITGLTGGGTTNLDGLSTAIHGVDTIVILSFGESAKWYKAVDNSADTYTADGEAIVQSLDDADIVWVKIGGY